MDAQTHKPHRKSKDKKSKGKSSGERNPKAFAFSNPGKLHRIAARSGDIKEKRLHVPLVDRIPDEPPPRLVAIVGPPGVGKTTLLKSLIRRYAKETITDPQGPVTVVTSKKQRLTFVECPNDLHAMVDIAKVADIVLLMIDGNYGFEMETMEFLNVLAATGMPGNVFGILTHLDLFRKPQALKDAKKRLKRRLWTELYQGAHLFYLSGVLNGRYPDREVHNLSRFLSVMKNPRPLVWRNSHPYTIIDSFRDVTHPTKVEEDPKCDRSIVLSGYLRGTNFAAQGQRVHVPGLGDFTIATMEALPDPCPTPSMEKALATAAGKTVRRRLDEKEKKLHAPMSDRSGLKIDGDAVWITREQGFTFDKDAEGERGEGEKLIIDLQAERRLLGQTDDGVQLFRGGGRVKEAGGGGEGDSGRKTLRQARPAAAAEGEDVEEGGQDVDSDEEAGGADGGEGDIEDAFDENRLGSLFRKSKDRAHQESDLAFADSDSDLGSISGEEREDGEDDDEDDDSEGEGEDDGEDDEGDGSDDGYDDSDEETAELRWKDNLAARASSAFHRKRRPFQTADLARLMYDLSIAPVDALRQWRGEDDADDAAAAGKDDDDNDDFFKRNQKEAADAEEDRMIPVYDYEQLAAKWADPERVEALQARFSRAGAMDEDEDGEGGGEGEGEDEFDGIQSGDEEDEDGDDGQEAAANGDGPEVLDIEAERARNAKRKEQLKSRFEHEDREGFFNDKAKARADGTAAAADEFGEDQWYDAQKAMIQRQLDINRSEYETLDERQRAAVEGFRAGKYAQIVLEGVPAEFVERFSARVPIVVGGLSATEDRFGFVQVRIKRHRWHKRILKTGDPLIVSLGWRRFQTLPIYSTSDSRTRNRMLKYTPEHMHCFGTFYGPLIAPNTGFVCFNAMGGGSDGTAGFRIAASGNVLSVDEGTEIVKKLKLTGTPYKIFKNTAFIKDMFNTALEVAKFEGAAIKTVSNVRGQIKRALAKPEGHFRATFEDKILMSDIVFLRAWYPIKPHRFYNPVANLVGWRPMRLTGEIRRAENLATPKPRNSQYAPVERVTRRFNPLQVPRALAASLPYKSQIVQTRKRRSDKDAPYLQKRAVVAGGAQERRERALMTQLVTLHKDSQARRQAKKAANREKFQQRMADNEEKKAAREKRETKEFWGREGKKRKAWEDHAAGAGGGGGGKKARRG